MNQTSQSFRWRMAAICIIALLAMTWVDYISGYELVFSAAYLIPVCLCAWYFRSRAIWLMCVASGLASWFADLQHPYSDIWLLYLNSFTCFVICLVAGMLLHRFKNALAEREQMNGDLQKALEELKRSTEEISKLQNGLQVVCAWTKQIKVGERWITPDEFLTTQLHLKISHGMSPEASCKFQEEISRQAQTCKM